VLVAVIVVNQYVMHLMLLDHLWLTEILLQHNGIEASGRKANWTAAAIFEVEDGKVKSFTKEWDSTL